MANDPTVERSVVRIMRNAVKPQLGGDAVSTTEQRNIEWKEHWRAKIST